MKTKVIEVCIVALIYLTLWILGAPEVQKAIDATKADYQHIAAKAAISLK